VKATTTVHQTVPARPVLSLPNAPADRPVAANDALFKGPSIRGARSGWDDQVLSINRKPSVREVYFIAAPKGARAPEFEGYHPGVILRVSAANSEEACTVVYVPLTTDDPTDPGTGRLPSYIHKLSKAPGPDASKSAWAICDHIMTANLCRLELFHFPGGVQRAPKIADKDFNAILDCIHSAIQPLRTRIENRMKAGFEQERSELLLDHAGKIAELRADHAREIGSLVELLDGLTTPQ
jgi:uncharacterized protein YifN (PemK superfamily)